MNMNNKVSDVDDWNSILLLDGGVVISRSVYYSVITQVIGRLHLFKSDVNYTVEDLVTREFIGENIHDINLALVYLSSKRIFPLRFYEKHQKLSFVFHYPKGDLRKCIQ